MNKNIIVLLLIGLVIGGKFEISLLKKEIESISKSSELTEVLYQEQKKIIDNILNNE